MKNVHSLTKIVFDLSPPLLFVLSWASAASILQPSSFLYINFALQSGIQNP